MIQFQMCRPQKERPQVTAALWRRFSAVATWPLVQEVRRRATTYAEHAKKFMYVGNFACYSTWTFCGDEHKRRMTTRPA